VIIGRSERIGTPLQSLLLGRNCTVTVAHSYTENLKDFLQIADVVVTGVGQANFITGDQLKEGSILIDCGYNEHNGEVVGDADFASCSEVCSHITPVPGGVGPMTIAMLLTNTVNSAWRRYEHGEVLKLRGKLQSKLSIPKKR